MTYESVAIKSWRRWPTDFIWRELNSNSKDDNDKRDRATNKLGETTSLKETEVQENLYFCFIDYQLAFDKVLHNVVIHMLDDMDSDAEEFRFI